MGSLKQRFHGPVAVCLELSKGPLAYALQKYDFLVLFPVNPATLAKYCYAFTPSHAKDDPTDADLQIEVLTQYRDKLKPLRPQAASMCTLQHLVMQRRGLVDDRVRITNRLTSNHGSTCLLATRIGRRRRLGAGRSDEEDAPRL